MSPTKKTKKRNTVLAAGKHLRLVCENGWEFAERTGTSGVVAVLAVTDDGELILTEQYRTAVRARVIDLPAGLAGDEPGKESEPLEEAARRELREETGYDADEFTRLATAPTSPGLTSETVTLFRAEGLRRCGPGGGDASEDIAVLRAPLRTLGQWLDERLYAGAAVDVKVYAGLYFLQVQARG